MGDLAGTLVAAPASPLGTRQVCNMVGEQPGKVPPAPSPCHPCTPLPSGAPERRVPGPPFLRRREAPPAPATSRPAPFQCNRSMVPPGSPRASIAPSAGRGRNKDPWKWEAGSPGEVTGELQL